MKEIQSKDNALIRQTARIGAGRDKSMILLEGVHLCQEWLVRYGLPQYVLTAASANGYGDISALVEQTRAIPQYLLSDSAFRATATVETPQGISFVAQRPMPVAFEMLDETALWLDRVQDPGNLGTILRTAAAVGIRRVLLSRGCVGAWSTKVLRSAQGAHFSLDIYEQQAFPEIRAKLRMPVLASSLQADSQSLFEATLPEACLWVLGHEGQGVDPQILALADQSIYIPQSVAVESLNVSVAAGVLLFEQRRQLSHRTGNAEQK